MHIVAVGEAFPKDWPRILKGFQKKLAQLGSKEGKIRELKFIDFVVEDGISHKFIKFLTGFKGSKLSRRYDGFKKKWFMKELMKQMKVIDVKEEKDINFNKKQVLRDWNIDPGNSFLYLSILGKVEDKRLSDGREAL